MSINGGRFAVSRDVFEHPVFKKEPFTECQAWIWLIAQAAWKPRRARAVSGRAVEMVNLERGQLCLALRFIQAAWRWPSEKRVRTFLKRLEIDAMVIVQTDALQNVITICNYDAHQFSNVEQDAQSDAQSDAQQTRNGRKLKKDNNFKNINKSKEDNTLAFDEWYEVYPRKKQPNDARRAFDKVAAAGNISLVDLLDRTKAFAATWNLRPADEQRFIPYPASWLNKAGYADEVDQPVTPRPGAGYAAQPRRRGNLSEAFDELIARARAAEQGGHDGQEHAKPVLRLLPPR
jgi:hypothetical protein